MAIDARRGGHVQALGGADVARIMNTHERAFVIALESCAGGAVGFVADNQVEIGQAMLMLGVAQHLDGVVGAEHDGHVLVVVTCGDALCQRPGIGGGREAQFVGEGLDGIVFLAPTLLAHVAVRAHGETVQRHRAFLRPLGQGLLQQGQTGHEEQHALALACHRLGDL